MTQRKLVKQYNPDNDKQINGDPKKTIFVGRLNFKTDERTLEENFSIYGTIKRLKLVRDVNTQKSKGYAFIEFAESRQAEIAYRRADYKRIDDKYILVDMEQARVDKYWLPRRLGGGKGGDTRQASKEHQEYLKEIKREIRKQEKDKQSIAHSSQKKSESNHPETLKRQKISENEEVKNPEAKHKTEMHLSN